MSGVEVPALGLAGALGSPAAIAAAAVAAITPRTLNQQLGGRARRYRSLLQLCFSLSGLSAAAVMLLFFAQAASTVQLYKAITPGGTEANFLEVLRGCGEAEVKYRSSVGYTVLMQMTIKHDWPEAAAAVIDCGCDVNAADGGARRGGWMALHYAGFHNRRETARVLLERGADRTIKNKKGETAADVAREMGNDDLAAYIDDLTCAALEEQSRRACSSATSELFDAAGNGWFTTYTEEAFMATLEQSTDAQVNYRDENGKTVLMQMAYWHDWPTAVAAVIERGCDVNATTKYDSTALHTAGFWNRRETARVLLEHGADRTIKDKRDGKTAAHDARAMGHADLAVYIHGTPVQPPRASLGGSPARRRPPPSSGCSPLSPHARVSCTQSGSQD